MQITDSPQLVDGTGLALSLGQECSEHFKKNLRKMFKMLTKWRGMSHVLNIPYSAASADYPVKESSVILVLQIALTTTADKGREKKVFSF